MSVESTAYHEAGHAAADLLIEHQAVMATIEPRLGNLGSVSQLYGDDRTVEGMENLVMSLYAGAEAEKHVNSDFEAVKLGASDDDEKAGEYLASLNSSEDDLRKRSAKLLSDNWRLVELIAWELLLHETLRHDELDILLSVYLGEMTMDDLEAFRVRFLRGT